MVLVGHVGRLRHSSADVRRMAVQVTKHLNLKPYTSARYNEALELKS